MTNRERALCKQKILKCLTEDFRRNQAIFNKDGGWQVFHGTNLTMVMDAVVKGLKLAQEALKEGVMDGLNYIAALEDELFVLKRHAEFLDADRGKLIAENARLREAAQRFVDVFDDDNAWIENSDAAGCAMDQLRAALEGGKDEPR
jgi:hypothetical protein